MNLKTAQRLLEYRKNAGLSQEGLAERIGVSRQAVSKWECAEASPDTDNLIALAKVYGITLDELIKGKSEISDEKTPATQNIDYHVDDDIRGEKVRIHVESNGNRVHINENTVFVHDDKGNVVKRDFGMPNGRVFQACSNSKSHYIFKHFPYPILAVVLYLVFGFTDICGGWAFGWLIFLTIPLYYTLISAICNRNASHFAYPVLVTAVYLYFGFFESVWHPMWLLFLSIPFYYFICEFLKKIINKT